MIGQKAKSVNCPAIDGIIAEAGEVTGEMADTNVLDGQTAGADSQRGEGRRQEADDHRAACWLAVPPSPAEASTPVLARSR